MLGVSSIPAELKVNNSRATYSNPPSRNHDHLRPLHPSTVWRSIFHRRRRIRIPSCGWSLVLWRFALGAAPRKGSCRSGRLHLATIRYGCHLCIRHGFQRQHGLRRICAFAHAPMLRFRHSETPNHALREPLRTSRHLLPPPPFHPPCRCRAVLRGR